MSINSRPPCHSVHYFAHHVAKCIKVEDFDQQQLGKPQDPKTWASVVEKVVVTAIWLAH